MENQDNGLNDDAAQIQEGDEVAAEDMSEEEEGLPGLVEMNGFMMVNDRPGHSSEHRGQVTCEGKKTSFKDSTSWVPERKSGDCTTTFGNRPQLDDFQNTSPKQAFPPCSPQVQNTVDQITLIPPRSNNASISSEESAESPTGLGACHFPLGHNQASGSTSTASLNAGSLVAETHQSTAAAKSLKTQNKRKLSEVADENVPGPSKSKKADPRSNISDLTSSSLFGNQRNGTSQGKTMITKMGATKEQSVASPFSSMHCGPDDAAGPSSAALRTTSPSRKQGIKRKSEIANFEPGPSKKGIVSNFIEQLADGGSSGNTCASPDEHPFSESNNRTSSDSVPYLEHSPSRPQEQIVEAQQPSGSNSDFRVESTPLTPASALQLQCPVLSATVQQGQNVGVGRDVRTESAGTYIFQNLQVCPTITFSIPFDETQGDEVQEVQIHLFFGATAAPAMLDDGGNGYLYGVEDRLIRPDDAMITRTFE